jgi:hypothetical protein
MQHLGAIDGGADQDAQVETIEYLQDGAAEHPPHNTPLGGR